MLLGDEVGLRADGSEHRASVIGVGTGSRSGRARTRSRTGVRVSYRAMQRAQESRPRAKSPFVAAFLSLLFPGSGARVRGRRTSGPSGFAAPLILVGALGGRHRPPASNPAELISFVLTPWVLPGVVHPEPALLVYRLVAIIDAYRVTVWLNALAANGGGRLGRPRLVFNPLSLAGLFAVILVMAGGHVVVARYDLLAHDFLERPCVFVSDQTPDSCDRATPSAVRRRRRLAGADRRADRQPDGDRHPAAGPGLGPAQRDDPAVGRHGSPEHPPHRLRPAARRRHLQHRHADRRLDRPDDEAGRDVQPPPRLRRTSRCRRARSRTPTAASTRTRSTRSSRQRAAAATSSRARARRAATTPSSPSSGTSTGSTSSTSSRSTSRASSGSSTRSAG